MASSGNAQRLPIRYWTPLTFFTQHPLFVGVDGKSGVGLSRVFVLVVNLTFRFREQHPGGT
jgi:hypothetical protein